MNTHRPAEQYDISGRPENLIPSLSIWPAYILSEDPARNGYFGDRPDVVHASPSELEKPFMGSSESRKKQIGLSLPAFPLRHFRPPGANNGSLDKWW